MKYLKNVSMNRNFNEKFLSYKIMNMFSKKHFNVISTSVGYLMPKSFL